MQLQKTKIIIVSILCVAIAFGGFTIPQRTYATGTPTFDGALNILTGAQAEVSAANWATQLMEWAEDELMVELRDRFVQEFINMINKETVKWIQGGGSPKFVTDWKGFIKDAGTAAVNQTISESELADLCTPFGPKLRIALIPETKPISKTARCTISDVVKNVQGFYDNFQNGGWLAYGESVKPQNNLYMQLVTFEDEIKIKSNLNQEASKQDATAGAGFLSVSTCAESNAPELYDQCVMNSGPGTTSDQDSACRAYAEKSATCAKSQVQTPGDAVAGTVRNLIGSDTQLMVNVEGILSAVINAGINRLMKEGLSLMSGDPKSGERFVPSAGLQSEIDILATSARNDLKGAITPTYNQWKAILDIKQLSATYNTQLGTNLGLIRAMQERDIQCPPNVTAKEDIAVSQTAEKIAASVATLQPAVDEAEAILKQIDEMDTNNIRQSALVNDAIKAFTAKYITHNPQNTAGTLSQQNQDAVNEQAGINTKLSVAVTRLGTCKSVEDALFGGLGSTSATQ